MNFYTFIVNNKEYKLRLNTRNIVALEKDLGKNPLYIFVDVETQQPINPTTEENVLILYHSLKALQPEITLDEAYDIFDGWLEEGNIIGDFSVVIVELYKNSGIFKKPKEKN